MGLIFNVFGSTDNMMAQLPWYEHIVLGGFCFGAVFMATDPVTSARTEKGKFIYGFLIGVMAIVIRVLNWLSRRYDACHPADEHLRSAD